MVELSLHLVLLQTSKHVINKCEIPMCIPRNCLMLIATNQSIYSKKLLAIPKIIFKNSKYTIQLTVFGNAIKVFSKLLVLQYLPLPSF